MPEMRRPIGPGSEPPTQPPGVDQPPPDAATQIENKVKGLENLDHECVLPGARTVGGSGAGGHYALNTEQIDAYAKEVDDIVEEAQECLLDLKSAYSDIKAPAPDKHSGFQAGKAQESMKAAATHLQGVINYGTQFAKDLRASAERYRAQEQHSAREFGKFAES
jgi:uncharacterized protein YukE